MAYTTVFSIGDRIPEAVLGLLAVAVVVLLALGCISARLRTWFGRRAVVFSALAAVGLVAFDAHNIGGESGWQLGAIECVPLLILLVYTFIRGTDWPSPLLSSRLNVGQLGILVCFGYLCVLALVGLQQVSAFDLSRTLDSGGASVVSGKVDTVMGYNWAFECVTVEERKFCYDDGPTSIGFHQSANNGGPIREGLQVRVTYIGETIVRLEIAEGANPAPPPSTGVVGIPKAGWLWYVVWLVGGGLLLLLVIWRYWLYYAALRRSQGRPIERSVRGLAGAFIEIGTLTRSRTSWFKREADPHLESLRRWAILSTVLWMAIVFVVGVLVVV